MKNWKRIVTAVAVAAVGLTVGLTSASASSSGPTPPTPTGPTASANLKPALQANTGTPPATSQNLYVPITPCRIVDTRSGLGPFPSGVFHNFYVAGTVNFTSQGGSPTGCGIPFDATAITATLTAVAPHGAGFLRAWPHGLSEPSATLVNYQAGASTGSGATIALQTGTTGPSLTVKNYGGPTNVVIDVSGYFMAQKEGLFNIAGGQFSGSQNAVTATNTSAGEYVITWDSNVQNCTPQVTPWPLYSTTTGPLFYAEARDDVSGFPNETEVQIWTLDNTTHLPVFTNDYYYLTVTC